MNVRRVLRSLIAGWLASPYSLFAQETPPDSAARIAAFQPIVEFLPIVSYDTDVGFGYGAKGVIRNHLGQEESFDMVAFNSTKGERWYRFVFSLPDFELRQGSVYPLAVDVIIDYDKWIKDSFFGIGQDSKFDQREYYTKEPLDISVTLSRGFTNTIVGQVGTRFRAVRNFNFAEGSRLRELPPPLNSSRVAYASIYASFRYDSRNSFINPSRGVVLEADAEAAPRLHFNDIAGTRLAGWIQYYAETFSPKTVLAARLGIQGVAGNSLPTQVLMSVGGSNTLRGSPGDRYLDRVAVVFNAEFRFPMFWRLGGVGGVDAGEVARSLEALNLRWAANPVAGLRLVMETFVVRLDVGFGNETTGFYFNFGQLF